MSTENNNKQTLFRFVNHRNPNLAETKKTNLAFIQRPNELKGVFDEVTAKEKTTKRKALFAEAKTFEATSIKLAEEIENGVFKALIKIGKSISKKEELTVDQLETCIDKYTELKGSIAVSDIWDNLIYQYLTQKDFYVKEVLAYILKALHVGYAQTLDSNNDELTTINGEDFVTKALSAVIIMPLAIFGREAEKDNVVTSIKELSNKDSSLLEINLENYEKANNTLSEKEGLIQLKSELENIKKKYVAQYEKELKSAQDKYNKDNAENLAAFKNLLGEIKVLEETKAPETDIAEAYKDLEAIELPVFEFVYKNALNWNDIYKQLSVDSFAYFIENFSNEAENSTTEIDLDKAEIIVVNDDELTIDQLVYTFKERNFEGIITTINNTLNALSKSILNETALLQNEYAKIGGVLLPVSARTNSVPHLSYILKANKRGFFNPNRGYVSLQVHAENTSWTVSNATITAETSLGTHTENIGTVQVVDNKINFPRFLRNKIRNISLLKIKIFFSNGRETVLDLDQVIVRKLYSGILSLKPTDIIGNPLDEIPIEGEVPSEQKPTQGKHFGLKRLGVAEYMKVTQSVHAYVPGEVSNIENVMASELRHKSINELIRSEDTITTSKTQEVEKVSDTTKVNRAEMQTEVAKELDRQNSFQAHANFTYNSGAYKFETGAAYASTNAQHISNLQAVTKSQEITERAMERVQSKVSEERISKIIQEVSLTNVHEYDNRGGLGDNADRPKHITGVYRWVDKKMKNQIYNYGKRTMFEFMIPEPAKLHRLATEGRENNLLPPVDPRKASAPHTMKNAELATKELLEYWSDIYGIEIEMPLPQQKTLEKTFNRTNIMPAPGVYGGYNFNLDFEKEENYNLNQYDIKFYCYPPHNGDHDEHYMTLGSLVKSSGWGSGSAAASYELNSLTAPPEYKNSDFSAACHGWDIGEFYYKFNLYYSLKPETESAWKRKHFDLIIEAYQTALDAHKEEVAAIEAEQLAKAEEQKDVMGNFYRIIEGDVLKHNCIAYLLQNYLSDLGQGFTDGDKMLNFKVNLGDDLDKYTAKAKFLEQAFEWSIKDYTFYPYFWADRDEWQKMYLSENTDTLFRSFLQAGLARVIVTVKPGFEEAVQYFLETGEVWLGGETPIIGDPLYMSITQEMRDPTGVPQGKYWITRIPTTLTILQSDSTGLKTLEGQALPIFPEDEPENCENPKQLETISSFTLDDAQMSRSNDQTTLN